MLRHIFPIPRTLPIMSGTARAWWYSCGSTRMPLAEDFQSWSTWVDGFSQHWRFRTVSWGRISMDTKQKSLRLGHAMDLHGFWFVSCFWIVGGGEWKGVPWLGMWILAASGHPRLSFLWGAADCTWWTLQPLLVRSTSWRLAPGMPQELGTWAWGGCWELIQWLSFQDRSCSAQWSTETRIFGPFPEASFEYLAKITVNLMGLCHLLVLPNGRRHLRMLFPLSKIEIDRQTFV